jgi:hypothetical protein
MADNDLMRILDKFGEVVGEALQVFEAKLKEEASTIFSGKTPAAQSEPASQASDKPKESKDKDREIPREEAMAIRSSPPDAHHPWRIGSNYYICTAGRHYIGRLVEVCDQELVLFDASWVNDALNWVQVLERGIEELDDVVPFPAGDIIIGRRYILEAAIWRHQLPAKKPA